MWNFIKEWLYQLFIAIDQFLNVFPFFGSADETISSRCFRLNYIRAYRLLEKFINALYWPFQGPNHCMNAYIKDVLGRQKPRKFYDRAIEMGIEVDPEKLGDLVEVKK